MCRDASLSDEQLEQCLHRLAEARLLLPADEENHWWCVPGTILFFGLVTNKKIEIVENCLFANQGGSTLLATVLKARSEIRAALGRARFHRLRCAEIELRSSPLPLKFHIRDLVGLDIVTQTGFY